jgi:hypothetical protein
MKKIVCESCEQRLATHYYRKTNLCPACLEYAENDDAITRGTNREDWETEDDEYERQKDLKEFKLKKNPKKKNTLKGGKGDNLTVDDVDQNELRMGMMVEMEHTDDKWIALEIVLDHLAEFPDYYTRLLKMEKEAEEESKVSHLWQKYESLKESFIYLESHKPPFYNVRIYSMPSHSTVYWGDGYKVEGEKSFKSLSEAKKFAEKKFDSMIKIDVKSNPVSWVKDEKIWEKAKKVVRKEYSGMMKDLYPIVVKVYKSMGGKIKK